MCVSVLLHDHRQNALILHCTACFCANGSLAVHWGNAVFGIGHIGFHNNIYVLFVVAVLSVYRVIVVLNWH